MAASCDLLLRPYSYLLLRMLLPIISSVPTAAYSAASFHVNVALAKQCITDARSRQKLYADAKRKDFTFAVGDEVLLSTQALKLKVNSADACKLLPKAVGPFKVVEQMMLWPLSWTFQLA